MKNKDISLKLQKVYDLGKRDGKKELIEKLIELLELDERYKFADEDEPD